MKEGILHEQKGKIFPYEAFAATLYGFNNGYCALCRVARGGPEPTPVGNTPEEMIELSFSGMTVLPEDLYKLTDSDVRFIHDAMNSSELENILKEFDKERNEEDMRNVHPMIKYNEEKKVFECLTHVEMVKILRDLKDLPPRKRIKDTPIELDGCINAEARGKYYSRQDGIEI